MGRNKLDKFRDNEARVNIIQSGKPIYDRIRGRWRELYFRNPNPVVLELACGKGEYTIGLARIFPERNFIGVDIKGSRIWKGSGQAEEENLSNVAFLRVQILGLENFFGRDEVDEIWITFPDPRSRDRDIRRRLTNPRFLEIYRNIMKPGGWVHLKTDNDGLFEYTRELLKETSYVSDLEYTYNLYNSRYLSDHYGIQTTYERKFVEENVDIKYLKFQIIQ